ncbi:MAG: TonB-dependent receptor [Rhizomicrobium sp.]
MRYTNRVLLSCAIFALHASTAWAAQTTDGPGDAVSGADTAIETVVVTAEKRVERFQDLPLAATVVSNRQIHDQKIDDISQLSLSTPAFTSHPGNGGYLTIRGVGTQSFARSAEGDVAMLLDGVALSGGANPQDPASLFDVQQVEVLEGPQSTLFGKNAAVGAINIVTNPPDPSGLQAVAHLDADDRGGVTAQGMVNLPVGDDAALRISGHDTIEPRVLRNDFNDKWNSGANIGGRARFLYAPSDRLKVNLIVDYNKDHGSGSNWAVVDAPVGTFLNGALAACGVTPSRDNDRDCVDAPSFIAYEDYGASAQVDYQFASGATLTSITADRVNATRNQFDSDSVAINDIFNLNDAATRENSFSEELRLVSPADAKIAYVVGAYFVDSHLTASGDQAGSFNMPYLYCCGYTFGNSFAMHGNSESYAIFGQATYPLTDALSLIGGLRFTHDAVSADNAKFVTPGSVGAIGSVDPLAGSAGHSDLSGKLGVQYAVDSDWMFYATASKGYKGPAINDQAPDPTVPLVVKPEFVYNYEIGTKRSLLGDRLQVAATIFYEDIRDYQMQIQDTATARSYFGNARAVNVRGLDLSVFGNVTDTLYLSGGLNYSDGKFGSGTFFGCGPTQAVGQAGCNLIVRGGNAALVADARGRQLLGSPKWKLVGFGQYHRSLGFAEGFLQADLVYSDAVTYTAVYDPGDTASSYWLLGGRLGLRSPDGHWSVAVFARNLLDQRVPVAVFDTPIASYLGAPSSHSQYLGSDSFRRVGISVDFDL